MGESSRYLRLSEAGGKVGFVCGSNEVWRMNQPFDWVVDEFAMSQLKDFVEGMVVTRFGVTPNKEARPLFIEAGNQKGSKTQKVMCLIPSDPDAPVQVQFDEEKEYHEVNRVRPLFDLLNPLSYKNRRIFSFDSILVRIEQVLKEQPKQSVIWDSEEEVWNLSGSNESTDELNDWVKQLQQMEARKFCFKLSIISGSFWVRGSDMPFDFL